MYGNACKVVFDRKKLFLYVSGEHIIVEADGAPVFELTPHSSVEKLSRRGKPENWPAAQDRDEGDFAFACGEQGGKRVFTWTGKSSNWKKKEYRLECDAKGFNFFVTVSGKGTVGKIGYFDGARADQPGSRFNFCEYYVPNYNTGSTEPNYRPSTVPTETYFELLVPPLYCYPFRTPGIKTWLGLGLLAKPGEYNFWQFDFAVQNARFWLTTDMEGHAAVDGAWEAPYIRLTAGNDEFKVLEAYSQYHYDAGIAKPYEGVKQHRWWYGPIMCGWCEQSLVPVPADMPYLYGGQHSCGQYVYADIARRLEEERHLKPAFIIVDDKWQDFYGTAHPDPQRWPDMRAWVDQMHAKGIRVVLWFRLWGGEGLPEDETYTGLGVKGWNKDDDERYADPTNPKYQARLKEILHTLLSHDEGCMDCDGFKLDFAFWMGYGRKVQTYGGQSGVELLHTLFKQIYDGAKAVKPDALINASPCHPYFSDLFDQVRLHDCTGQNRDEVMDRRLRVYDIACPNHSVDTDSCFSGTRYSTMRYIRHSVEIGIPDMYQITDPQGFELTKGDWDEIRKIWEDYTRKMDGEFKNA